MSAEPTLAGERILVAEDDYLLALDAESALTSVGAIVVGPFANESAAAEAIRNGGLTAALTDINLGDGPSFKLAKALKEAQLPFAFISGYDRSSIPEEFRDVPCFIKPIDTRRLAREFSRFLQTARA